MGKIKTDKLSDNNIQDLFAEAFAKVASYHNISTYSTKCIRTISNPKIRMELMIVGFAGSPTIDDFKNATIEEVKSIKVNDEDGNSLIFNLIPSETSFLNSNDYIIVYESE